MNRWAARLSDSDGDLVLSLISSELGLSLVSYGVRALSLQLADAPSPHAVNLEASFANGHLLLVFYASESESARLVAELTQRSIARGIKLQWESA